MGHVVQHGPTPVEARTVDGNIVIEFSNAVELKTNDGKALRGLEIGGIVGTFEAVHDDKISIEGNRITNKGALSHRIRYAWKPNSEANLVNEEGLPASTFEIEVKTKM